MEFSEVLAKRRSVRHFNAKLDVSDEDIRALIEAAVVAPTAGNIQPWRFTVVRSIEARERLAGALHQRWATTAPVVIVVSVDPRPCYARYGDRGERLYAIQDSAVAAEQHPAGRGRPRACVVLDRRVRRRRGARGPRHRRAGRAGRDPAGRLLGRVRRSPGAPPARRGRHLDLEEAPDVVGLGCTSLDEIRELIGDCHRCPLGDTRTTLVFGVGDPAARVMFVGEAPGKNEDLKGEPFVGAAGQLLNELLAHAGLTREDVYIANVLKCRPPNNRDPEPAEIETCTPFLREQIRVIEPGGARDARQLRDEVRAANRRRHHEAARPRAAGRALHRAADLPSGSGDLRPHEARRRSSRISRCCAIFSAGATPSRPRTPRRARWSPTRPRCSERSESMSVRTIKTESEAATRAVGARAVRARGAGRRGRALG